MESPSQVIWARGCVKMVAHCAREEKEKKSNTSVFISRNRGEKCQPANAKNQLTRT
jgi:hypothetical protein